MKTTKRKSQTAAKTAAPAAEVTAPITKLVAPGKAQVSVDVCEAPASAAAAVIALASHCMVKDAARLKTDLSALVDEATDVTIDVGAIERIDTSTVQLLYAFARDRAARKQNVVWKGESRSWREAVRLLGLRELLGFAADGSAQ